jgi:hypothetical protein
VEEAVTAAAERTRQQSVEPKAIPDALRALWRDCCSAEPRSDVSRALIVNFIAVVDGQSGRDLRGALDGMVARVPCRAFLVTLGDVVAPLRAPILATVSGAARLHGPVRDLVLEQIELQAPRGAADQLAGVVRPLLVNDLPTHCYWGGDWPADGRVFDLFAALADHTIVDSGRFSAPVAQLDAVEQRRARGRAVTDLTWMRLRPWRRGLAEALERFTWRPDVPTSVAIRCGDAAVAGALLFGRWLERRLAAKVVLEETGSRLGCPDAIELRHGDNSVTLAYAEPGQVEVGLTTADLCYLPFAVPASRGNEASLLAAAIDLA